MELAVAQKSVGASGAGDLSQITLPEQIQETGGGREDRARNLTKSLFGRIHGGLFEAGRQVHFILYPKEITVKSAPILEGVPASN